MKKQKEMIAMLLAGGQGSRLYALTQDQAKPAVPFGGKYRIIDFPLSNCVNSGIDTVGVLTQYQPHELNEYIGNGQPWGLNRNNVGGHILQPYQASQGMKWFTATANAIYQNIRFIENYNPKYVIILSGDHIYKMNYNKMLDYHKANNANCTIAVMDVPMEEASRFGIMNTNPDGTIYEFEEKPKKPKSTLASMGIYIFNWEDLHNYLEKANANEASDHDFGKNIIPLMLGDGKKMIAYTFDGYWKDVGTIDSLWEANMDLINPKIPMNLNDKSFKIYARNVESAPTYIDDNASIQASFITKGCTISGTVYQSIISSDCVIEEGAEVKDSVVMPGCIIRSGAKVNYAILGNGAVIENNAEVGQRPEEFADASKWGVATVGPNQVVKEGEKVPAKGMVGMPVKK